jgi:SAM-dependent methyltransferase
MPVNLDQVVPWGRSFDEYVRMFELSERDLSTKILDCGAGPASFNFEMHRAGRAVISVDPIYRFSAPEIERRITETYDTVVSKTRESRQNFLWLRFRSPEHLGDARMRAMKLFLEDFPRGRSEGRYRVGELPQLPFAAGEFDLALCSHFLFTYSHLLPLDFHFASVRELCRVAREARIFPLLPNFGEARSLHLDPLIEQLAAEGHRCEIRRVPYEFQKGGNEMLRVTRFEYSARGCEEVNQKARRPRD